MAQDLKGHNGKLKQHCMKLFIVAVGLIVLTACKQQPRINKKQDLSWYYNSKNTLLVADSFKFLLPHLDSMILDDQRYRQTDNNHQLTANWWHLQDPLDSANTIKLKALIRQYGWLGVKQIGVRVTAIHFMIQHCYPITEREYFFPIVLDAYSKGAYPSIGLFAFIDRYLWSKNEPQLFGTQLVTVGNKVTMGLKDIYPIYQPMEVNQRWKRYSTYGDYRNFTRKSFKTEWDSLAYQQYIPELARIANVQLAKHVTIDMMLYKLDSLQKIK
jgi:hypothetical protein